ncbi:MAG: adenylate/guanylate cyclase domain-containing protein, partial [Dehalococcoidia bacterium]
WVYWTLATEAVAYVAYGSDRDENRAHGEFIRACIGPEYFAEGIVADLASIDVSDSARRVQAPTLVMSHSGLQFITMEMTRELVTLIPNAQLAIIEGTWSDNVEAMLDRAIAFLYPGAEIPPRASGIPSGTATQTGLTVILFADIVDSTALTERLGDTAFRNKARDLDATLRAIIRDHAGTPIEGKLLGDGVLAVFTSARQAIEAALVCGRSGHDTGLPLHLGLHAGDVIREENPDGRSNVYGGAVNIAARISGLSVPGQLLVSDTVRSLARTSAGVRFAGHGEHSLKGIEEPVRVYEVREG